MNLINPEPILLPVILLVLWTLVMQTWMVIARLPAMQSAGLNPQDAERTSELAARLPKEVQWKADNYNHLMEQPTIFYAAALAVALAGEGDGLNLLCAWVYVISRVAHSIVHATVNRVMIRFPLFGIGSLALLVLAISGLTGLL